MDPCNNHWKNTKHLGIFRRTSNTNCLGGRVQGGHLINSHLSLASWIFFIFNIIFTMFFFCLLILVLFSSSSSPKLSCFSCSSSSDASSLSSSSLPSYDYYYCSYMIYFIFFVFSWYSVMFFVQHQCFWFQKNTSWKTPIFGERGVVTKRFFLITCVLQNVKVIVFLLPLFWPNLGWCSKRTTK